MPTINMADSDWQNVLATFLSSGVASLNPAGGPIPTSIDIPVTFAASEVFSEFDVQLPWAYWQADGIPGTWAGPIAMSQGTPPTLDDDAINFTEFTPIPVGVEISGENTTADSVTITFTLNFYVYWGFASIS